MPNQVSIWFIQEAEVGVKWKLTRGCSSSLPVPSPRSRTDYLFGIVASVISKESIGVPRTPPASKRVAGPRRRGRAFRAGEAVGVRRQIQAAHPARFRLRADARPTLCLLYT